MSPHKDSLEAYRRKRKAGETPEPFGGETKTGSPRVGGQGLFVMQKHAARRTHYDLRLELDGVLKSWAVPRGPSLDPQEKRLAVETEDHPIEYGDFEGIIPEENYGAGAMIVWDRGTWVPLEDPAEGYIKGKLLFELRGYKLRGVWTIFRTNPPAHRRKKGDPDQWLLMKKPDEAASTDREPPEPSILSGLTVEELRDGDGRIHDAREDIEDLDLLPYSEDPEKHKLMLAQPGDKPFSRKGWIFELKYDGYRLLAGVRKGQPYLRYRNGYDATALFPEIARTLAALPVSSVLLDGEVVVLDGDSRPSFSRLQQRALLSKAHDIQRAAVRLPATFFAFDLIEFEGHDLRPLEVVERKALLQKIVPAAGAIHYCDHIAERGEAFLEQIGHMRLEGMVAKRSNSSYVGRRSADWLKFRHDYTDDFVIVGYTLPKGQRKGLASLHVATADDNGGFLYAGRVGTGFSDAVLKELTVRLEELATKTAQFTGDVPGGRTHRWVRPELVCEVRYKERTPQRMLRHPVFLCLREDKEPEDCTVQEPHGTGDEPPKPAQVGRPGLNFTNPDKIFWPEDGYTKGDLVDYYRKIAPAILPFLRDRPVVLTRYPDGVNGKSFFQKNAPDFAPEWIRTETIWSEGSERDIDYFVCNDEETLLYLANLATIPLHVWSSRLQTLSQPDWCILDLDPKDAPFSDVVQVALEIHRLCKQIELPHYVKTSGSSGLHILIPLGATCNYEQSRTLGMLIAQIVSRTLPKISTIVRTPSKRGGKVYIDYLQNGHGRLLVAPYCVRPLVGAPVSAPLRWSEVGKRLKIGDYTIKNMPTRFKRQKSDPLLPVLSETPDLLGALQRLSELS